jgi:hypothetical protein
MTFDFRAEDGSAVCDRDALRILLPRVQPGRTEGEAEFEFTILMGDARSSVAFVGFQRPPLGQRPAFVDVRLDPARALAQILRIREAISAPEAPREYLRGFARGLLAVYEDGRNLWEDTEFQVSVAPETLLAMGLEDAAHDVAHEDGRLVLASITVRARRGAAAP